MLPPPPPRRPRSGRLDIRILTKQVRRIVFSFECAESFVVSSVDFPHRPFAFFQVILEGVYVHCPVKKRLQPFPEVACLLDSLGIVCWIVPDGSDPGNAVSAGDTRIAAPCNCCKAMLPFGVGTLAI